MSEFFVKIYLDEDVNVLVAELIRFRKFEGLTVSEAVEEREKVTQSN